MFTLTVVATKGGVGKTTMAANLGGLLCDLGLRVLLIDADVQPSLTRYFKVSKQSQNGLTTLVINGALTDDCIATIALPPSRAEEGAASEQFLPPSGRLDLVPSDTRDGRLQDWLSNRLDRLVRIRMSIRTNAVSQRYDVIIIDTQGAVGHLQDAAVNAADVLVTPASPDVISAREFVDGTLLLLDRHESSANMGFTVPAMKAIINRTDNTVDSRTMAGLLREQFMTMRGRVTVLETTVPSIVAFRKAATAQIPVHWQDPDRAGDVMHQLLWELIPSLEGKFAPNHRKHKADSVQPGSADGQPSAVSL